MLSIKCAGAFPLAAVPSRRGPGKSSSLRLQAPQWRPGSLRTGALSSASLVRTRSCIPCFVAVKDGSNHSEELPQHPDLKPEAKTEASSSSSLFEPDLRVNGKSGLVSFYSKPGTDAQATARKYRSLLWLLGPTLLVSSVVLPPYVFRVLFEFIFDDSVITDFLVLFAAEAHFYLGVVGFLSVVQIFRGALDTADTNAVQYTWGYGISSVLATVLSIGTAATCFYFGWAYTGPAAIAAFLPYLTGFVVQAVGEKYAQDKPAVRPLVPIVFQLYRLHQLNRAAQLVAGLLFSMKGVEAVNKVAITNSLQMLLATVQLLGVLAIWSLASFLMQSSLAWHHGKGTSLVPF